MNINRLIVLICSVCLSVEARCRTGQIIENKTLACFDFSREFGAVSRFHCGLGKVVLFKLFDRKACNLEDDNVWADWDNCLWSQQLGRSVCVTPEMIYAVGRAAHETCNSKNNGWQKCIGGDLGVIKCQGSEILNYNFKCNEFGGSLRKLVLSSFVE